MKRLVRTILKTSIPGICLLLLLGLSASAYAAQPGSIRVVLKETGAGIPDIAFTLYRVGTAGSGTKGPELDEKYGINAYPQTAAEVKAAVAAIQEKIDEKPLQTKVTDAGGILEFSGLEEGVYYVEADEKNSYGEIMPFLIQLPYYENAEGEIKGPYYQAEAEPKKKPYPGETEETGDTSETGETQETKETGTAGGKDPDSKTDSKSSKNTLKTEDTARLGLYLCILASSLFLMSGIIMKKVRRRNE